MSRQPGVAALQTRGLSVNYGGVRALVELDLEVHDGEIVGLIGPNGAGKTTCMDAIGGLIAARGTVAVDGTDISRLRPHQRSRAGLARTWQSTELFADLSVVENLIVAGPRPSARRMARQLLAGRDDGDEQALEALRYLGVGHLATARPDDLPTGLKKLVGIARALVASPRVLCLDEPAAGLDVGESEDLGRRLRGLADDGLATLLVEHDMGLVLGVCDRVIVLEFGTTIASGPPDVVRADPRVIEAYLGTDTTQPPTAAPAS